MFRSHRAVGRAKPPARHFDVAQVLRGVPAVRLSSAGNGASFSAFRQHTRVRLLPALRFGSGGACIASWQLHRIDPKRKARRWQANYSAKGARWRKSTADGRSYPGTYFIPKSAMKLSRVVFGWFLAMSQRQVVSIFFMPRRG